ncbi:NAD-dependent epimerase/dehydratase family protein [Tropicibacter oceani]|uniref:NAD-dependent epimerase/dehydratase family protein n=1 Tax=Tropicibacter oceani TaxID=3058420 RepID=A0ABY8QKA1_9RHOB|nr:NAD-dependent epimerase/dehydratase family protein [Tropicibacter oceani]WGW04456.1 NAD-dependent epimerase/dehydratase family protein [Tropicibacter oceani]
MGEMTRLMITGATGFVGSAAVRAARARGLKVVATYRKQPLPEWAGDTGILAVKVDLAQDPAGLASAMEGVGAVIHAAAHLGGDAAAHKADTLRGTAAILDAAPGTARIVLVSSIAVYDTMRLTPGDRLDESAPLEDPDHARDAYTAAKLRQEDMVRSARPEAWLIRAGAVYGPGRTWNALMGFWASKLHVQIGQTGELPLIHVDHLADVLIRAALAEPDGIQAVNALDDDRPSRARFQAAHRRLTGWPKLVLPVPFGLWLGFVRLLKPVSARLPGLFVEPILRARLMPLVYPNTALRHALGGKDIDSFEAMLARSVRGAA